jgi:uncharacterized protein
MQVPCTAFEGSRRIASGELGYVAAQTKPMLERGGNGPVLIFHDRTGEVIDVDWRTVGEIGQSSEYTTADHSPPGAREDAGPEPRGPGRPKLGVVAREVTLLPRHWDWLATQPGGASVALRKLV